MKKPFNPILGETYEFVHEKYRCVAEQVSHHPPISAYAFEGRNYEVIGYNHLDQSFKFGSGAGMLAFKQNGTWRINFSKYGDEIVICKPDLSVNNLIVGTMYLDIDGKI